MPVSDGCGCDACVSVYSVCPVPSFIFSNPLLVKGAVDSPAFCFNQFPVNKSGSKRWMNERNVPYVRQFIIIVCSLLSGHFASSPTSSPTILLCGCGIFVGRRAEAVPHCKRPERTPETHCVSVKASDILAGNLRLYVFFICYACEVSASASPSSV